MDGAIHAGHPITKVVNYFIVTDKQHYMTYDKNPKYVLAQSVNKECMDFTETAGRRGNSAEAVWACGYEKGRVCFTPHAHMVIMLWNPEYEKMQKNAAKWPLRES